MTDKVQKIKDWISKEQDGLMDANGNFDNPSDEGAFHILSNLDYYIDSLQEEPVSEDNTLRKASEEYLKVLSETPYNNTPITNAQTIVRELITFLDNPSKYNPNHIEEPVSEDTWEASKQYALRQVLASTDVEMSEQAYLDLRLFSGFELAVAHKDGTQLQKEQIIKRLRNHANIDQMVVKFEDKYKPEKVLDTEYYKRGIFDTIKAIKED